MQSIMMGRSQHVGPISTVYYDGAGDLNMWVDYRCPLSTVYNDGEISTYR